MTLLDSLDFFENSRILITGGTGSLGKKLTGLLINRTSSATVIVYSRDEYKQFIMHQMYSQQEQTRLRFFLGDVRDKDRLVRACEGVDYIIHAAALKQVPAAEYNPFEFVKTNVLGAEHVIQAALANDVRHVVALSTDKAVNPINLYGATKLCSDKLFVAGNNYGGMHKTRFAVVRYGNVVGSRGSVIPFFMAKRKEGVLPITDPRMTRFWITLDQGAALVLNVLRDMSGGEIFVPKIPSMRILDLATVIDPSCEKRVVGIRPGEKLHEVMIPTDDAPQTVEFDNHFVIVPVQKYVSDMVSLESCLAQGGTRCPSGGFYYGSENNTEWLNRQEMETMIALLDLPEIEAWRNEREGKSLDDTDEAFIPYGRQSIDENDVHAICETVRSAWLTTGPKVEAFEQAFVEYTTSSHAVAVCNGTAALHAAVFAMGIGPGDEVIVPAITFVATANAVLYQGGTPVFADVNPDTLLIDVTDVERRITPATKAVIAVDYAGQPCDYDALRDLADRHQLLLAADACHALGASYKGRMIGSLADLNTFSFHPIKPITTAEGGMITTHRADWAKSMRRFRSHGVNTDFRQRMQNKSWEYAMQDLGYNYRLSDLHCSLGISQLRKIDKFTQRRRELARRYQEAFKSLPAIQPLKVLPGNAPAWHLFVIRVESNVHQDPRAELFVKLREQGLGVNVHYMPVYLHPYYERRYGAAPGKCPSAEAAYAKLISLPIFPDMTNAMTNKVISCVKQAVEDSGL